MDDAELVVCGLGSEAGSRAEDGRPGTGRDRDEGGSCRALVPVFTFGKRLRQASVSGPICWGNVA
jgi:hypothetical protein